MNSNGALPGAPWVSRQQVGTGTLRGRVRAWWAHPPRLSVVPWVDGQAKCVRLPAWVGGGVQWAKAGLNYNGIYRLQRCAARVVGVVFSAAARAAPLASAFASGSASASAPASVGSGTAVAGWLGTEGGAFAGWLGQAWAAALLCALILVLGLLLLFALRHGLLLLSRLFGTQRQAYANVVSVDWPPVTVVLLAANHATTIEACLHGLLACDYPAPRLQVVVVTDHASDGTPALIDHLAEQHPGRVSALHRNDPADFGAGASASLQAAMARVSTDFVIVFDPTHAPAAGMVRRLMAPFCDAEVGAVTGRLVGRTDPRFAGAVAYGSAGASLAARLTELERSGASQVGQRASANLGLAPQQTGLWGAVRLTALRAAGGWPSESMGADVTMHSALRQAGWLTVYQPNAELFDEPASGWLEREQQLQAVAHGQQAALHQSHDRRGGGAPALAQSLSPSLSPSLSLSRRARWATRLDMALRLRSHWAAPLLLLAWVLTSLLYFVAAPEITAAVLVAVVLLSYAVMSNSSAFFEQAGAALLDRSRLHVRLLPLSLLAFVGTALAALRGTLGLGQAAHTYPDDPMAGDPHLPPALEPLQPYPKFEPALQHPFPNAPGGPNGPNAPNVSPEPLKPQGPLSGPAPERRP
jgi:cellulose synthase/poly-beta-1,6-N-acetylglucosamine synthase-like glycosyltransferase